MSEDVSQITRLLQEAHDEGRREALDKVVELVYSHLQGMAAKQLRGRYGHRADAISLEPAGLVNETFLRLIKQRKQYDSSGHFFAIATKVMVRVIKDYDRNRRRLRRRDDNFTVTLSGVENQLGVQTKTDGGLFIELIENLENLDERTAEVVKLRVLWGLTVPEIARTIGVSVSTVEREWRFARRWISAELELPS